jgi:cobalt/nickel transport protein
MKITARFWIGLAMLIAMSPLGLLLPAHFKAGDAWGEWSGDTLKELVGYIPIGLEKLSSLWNAPLPDYALKGSQGKGLAHLSLVYIVSALVGVAVVVLVAWLIGKMLSRKGA